MKFTEFIKTKRVEMWGSFHDSLDTVSNRPGIEAKGDIGNQLVTHIYQGPIMSLALFGVSEIKQCIRQPASTLPS